MTVVLTENSSKRRDQLVIMAEIINIAKKGTSKTHIMFAANLSFSQLNLYIDLLSEANLLEKTACKGNGPGSGFTCKSTRGDQCRGGEIGLRQK